MAAVVAVGYVFRGSAVGFGFAAGVGAVKIAVAVVVYAVHAVAPEPVGLVGEQVAVVVDAVEAVPPILGMLPGADLGGGRRGGYHESRG